MRHVGRRGPTPPKRKVPALRAIVGKEKYLLQGSAIFKGEMRKVNQVIELSHLDQAALMTRDVTYWAKRVWVYSGFPDEDGTEGTVVDINVTKEPI